LEVPAAMMPSALGNTQSLSMLEGLLTALSLNSHPIHDGHPAHPNEDEKMEADRFTIRQSMLSNLEELCNWMRSQINQFREDTVQSIDRLLESSQYLTDSYFVSRQRAFQRNLSDTKIKLEECLKMDPFQSVQEVDGPIPLSFECTDSDRSEYVGSWSKTFRGNEMTLSPNQKVVTLRNRFQSIRFDSGISRGMMVQIDLRLCCTRVTGNFIGVTSPGSECDHFNKRAMDESGILDCYGIDTCSNRIYLGNDQRFTETEFQVPKAELVTNDQSVVTMVVDLTPDDHGILLFSFQSADNEDKSGYMITLPADDGIKEWFPAVSLSRLNSWCEILRTQVLQ